MRTLVIGAGAIGRFFAAKLTEGGADVLLYGLGESFEKMAISGIPIAERGKDVRRVAVKCSLSPPGPDGWDVIVFAVKAQDLPLAAQQFASHAREATVVLPQNGLPYWQFLGIGGQDRRLISVDPEGLTEKSIPIAKIAGCVVTKGLTVLEDETLIETVVSSDSFALGDVVQGSGVAKPIVSLLRTVGLPATESSDIRTEKWRKLLVNVAFNPLGALSHLGFGEVLDVNSGERLARAIINEALGVAHLNGMRGAIDSEAALARARSSRLHKTSMLQDVEAGRRLEIQPILGVLLELAKRSGLPVPTLQTIYDCVRLVDHALAKGPIRQASKAH
jgi:2-dehydropantoate 2-reductase